MMGRHQQHPHHHQQQEARAGSDLLRTRALGRCGGRAPRRLLRRRRHRRRLARARGRSSCTSTTRGPSTIWITCDSSPRSARPSIHLVCLTHPCACPPPCPSTPCPLSLSHTPTSPRPAPPTNTDGDRVGVVSRRRGLPPHRERREPAAGRADGAGGAAAQRARAPAAQRVLRRGHHGRGAEGAPGLAAGGGRLWLLRSHEQLRPGALPPALLLPRPALDARADGPTLGGGEAGGDDHQLPDAGARAVHGAGHGPHGPGGAAPCRRPGLPHQPA
jgi:hypothetical protein